MQDQLRSGSLGAQSRRSAEMIGEVEEKEEEKRSFEEDLALLTEPFGISMVAMMAKAGKEKSRAKAGSPNVSYSY